MKSYVVQRTIEADTVGEILKTFESWSRTPDNRQEAEGFKLQDTNLGPIGIAKVASRTMGLATEHYQATIYFMYGRENV